MITRRQQNYYRKCVRVLSKVTGTDPDGMHEVIKHCLERKTVHRMRPESFKDFTEQLYCWAANTFDIRLPDAKTKKTMKITKKIWFDAVCEVCTNTVRIHPDTLSTGKNNEFVFDFTDLICPKCEERELRPVERVSTEVQ